MSDELTVTGGAYGLAVCLEELQDGAQVLQTVGCDAVETAAVIGSVALEPALALAGVVAPGEYRAAEAAILHCAGHHGGAGAAARVLATAEATRTAVELYRAGEATAQGLFDATVTSIGLVVGASVAVPAMVAGAVAMGALARMPALGQPAEAAVLGLALGLGQDIDELLVDVPGLVPAVAEGVDGLVVGLGMGIPALGTWLRWRSGQLGVPYPPRTHQEALRVVLAGSKGIALDESAHDVQVTGRSVEGGRAPRTVADLVDDTGPTSSEARVRITGLPQPDGSWSWVVDVPVTQTFTPRAGQEPWDLTSNVLLAAGQQTLTMQAVSRALADAQQRAGGSRRDRVLLAGRSQGGLTAAALAADPDFRRRFHVTHVVTAGAPVARLEVPPEVSVLSLEHTEDPVPGLDGADNPDRPNWVTVERSVSDVLAPDDGASDAHASDRYARTARLVDDSLDPSLTAWREGAGAYLDDSGGEPVIVDYTVERLPRASATVAGSGP